MPSITKIICPVDFMQHSGMVADYAAMIAKSFGAEVEVLYVSFTMALIGNYKPTTLQSEELEKDMVKSSNESMDNFLKKHFSGIKATGKVVLGDPADEIVKRVTETGADLVIMGTHGRRGFDLLLFGSVAEKVVRLSPAPVLTVRPKK